MHDLESTTIGKIRQTENILKTRQTNLHTENRQKKF